MGDPARHCTQLLRRGSCCRLQPCARSASTHPLPHVHMYQKSIPGDIMCSTCVTISKCKCMSAQLQSICLAPSNPTPQTYGDNIPNLDSSQSRCESQFPVQEASTTDGSLLLPRPDEEPVSLNREKNPFDDRVLASTCSHVLPPCGKVLHFSREI